MVLHTWDQQLRPHFHVHCVIAAGALAEDGSRWIEAGRNFLFPVRALSKVFRAKYLESLQELLEAGRLDVPSYLRELNSPQRQRRWLRTLRRKSWNVYSKAPFAGPQKLLDYLGRYTHRVAISNHRLLACENGQVRFAYRDRADGDRKKTASLSVETFIGRFLLHVLPPGSCESGITDSWPIAPSRPAWPNAANSCTPQRQNRSNRKRWPIGCWN